MDSFSFETVSLGMSSSISLYSSDEMEFFTYDDPSADQGMKEVTVDNPQVTILQTAKADSPSSHRQTSPVKTALSTVHQGYAGCNVTCKKRPVLEMRIPWSPLTNL